MRGASRSWSLLVLVLLGALLGPPAVASAGDAGLRTLVTEQRADEQRIQDQVDEIDTSAGESASPAQAGRRLSRTFSRVADGLARLRVSYDGYRPRFDAEQPETNEATVGRTLMARGLRDGSVALRRLERAIRRFAADLRRVRSSEGFERVGEQLERRSRAPNRLYDRSEKRLKRGRTLIRTAPAVAPPAV